MKKILFVVISFVLLQMISACSNDSKASIQSSKEIMKVNELHNGDAKFYKDNIVTQVGGKFTIFNLNGEKIAENQDVYMNWIDCTEDGVVVYGNFNREVGILKIDDKNEIVDNKVIIKSEKLMIDPTITKVGEEYYITVTEIDGNVNNADTGKENGVYTIKLYKTTDLENLHYISDIYSAKNNLEDVDVIYIENRFKIFFEKEEIDKGSSSICLMESSDNSGKKWNEIRIIVEKGADNEPAYIEKTEDGYRVWYSSDIENKGESYQGGKVFFLELDEKFDIRKEAEKIETENKKGILLYDIMKKGNNYYMLISKDYLTTCDLVIEKISDK